MTELTRTVNNVNDLSTAQSDISSLQESVNTNTTNITTLQSYIVLNGTNFGVGSDVLPAGTYNTVSKIDTAIMDINAPYAMSWVANTIYTYDSSSSVQALTIWDTLNFGNSANMTTKSTWTCPVAGLWHIAPTFGFSMNLNYQPCSFQLYYNRTEVWYFTAWYNISTATEGIITQYESIFLNLAVGDTLEWYLLLEEYDDWWRESEFWKHYIQCHQDCAGLYRCIKTPQLFFLGQT